MKKKHKKKRQKYIPVSSDKVIHKREAEYQQFIRFIALSRPIRQKEFGFVSFGDFAKKYKLHVDTLTDWQKEEGFWKEVKKLWRRWGRDRTPDIIHGLYQKAVTEGDAPRVKLWMQIIEEWAEKTELKHSGAIGSIGETDEGNEYDEFTDAELLAEDRRQRDFLIRHKKKSHGIPVGKDKKK